MIQSTINATGGVIPFVKWFGRRIRNTRRRGDVIHVKLVGARPGDPPEWIIVPPDAYTAGLRVQCIPERDPIPDRYAETVDREATTAEPSVSTISNPDKSPKNQEDNG